MKYPEPSNMSSFYEPPADPKADFITAVCEAVKVPNVAYLEHERFIISEAGKAYHNEDSISEAAEKITQAIMEPVESI